MFTSYDLRLDWNQPLPKYWCDTSPFKTHFFNALSITFPYLEKFFITAFKYHKDNVTDAQLAIEVAEFIKQENWHSYAHQQYNMWTASLDLPVGQLSQQFDNFINRINEHTNPKTKLAITVCLEHVTTISSSLSLRNRELHRQMHSHFEHIWRWHNIEEIEHKAVSMDLWLSQFPADRSYQRMMILTTILFWYTVFSITIKLLYADKQLWQWRNVTDFYNIIFSKAGIFRLGYSRWLDFFKNEFHPNNHDDTILLKYRKG
jgi:predicted metal-dependent hydrolase